MAETIVLMSSAQPAIDAAKSMEVDAKDIELLQKLATEFDAIASTQPGPDRTRQLVDKTREVHRVCQKIAVTMVAKVGGAAALPSNPACNTLLEKLQAVRNNAALEATRQHG